MAVKLALVTTIPITLGFFRGHIRHLQSQGFEIHVVQGERDIIRELSRAEAWIGPDAYVYYQDVGDNIARVADEVDTYLDVASGIMDIYLSAQGNKLNQIMKQLTVVATIFMPLSLVTGIYGMNLIRGMWPGPEDVWGFSAVMGTMVVMTVGMVVWFKKKQWW